MNNSSILSRKSIEIISIDENGFVTYSESFIHFEDEYTIIVNGQRYPLVPLSSLVNLSDNIFMPTLNTCKKNELINNFYKKINENPDKKSKYSDDINVINFENTFENFDKSKKYAIDYIESKSLLINFIGAVDYDFRNVKENGDLITYFCRDLPNQLEKFPLNTSNSNNAIKIRTLIDNGCLNYIEQLKRWYVDISARHNNEPEKNIIVNAINFFRKTI